MKSSIKYQVLSIKGGVAAFLLATYYLIFNTYVVYAACDIATETETELGCVPNNPVGATKLLYGVGLGLVGGVGLLFIIYGGYLILSSQGDPTQLRKGKSYITYSIIGIILAIAGFALYQIISVDVLHLPGFSK